jgi:hypothetical protein
VPANQQNDQLAADSTLISGRVPVTPRPDEEDDPYPIRQAYRGRRKVDYNGRSFRVGARGLAWPCWQSSRGSFVRYPESADILRTCRSGRLDRARLSPYNSLVFPSGSLHHSTLGSTFRPLRSEHRPMGWTAPCRRRSAGSRRAGARRRRKPAGLRRGGLYGLRLLPQPVAQLRPRRLLAPVMAS